MTFTNETPPLSIATYRNIWGNTQQVSQLSSFPSPVNGVITLPPDTSWQITGHVDLGENRLVCEGAACIYGASAETCSLTATPPTGDSIISSTQSLSLHKLAITTPIGRIGVSVNGALFGNIAIDWSHVNFFGPGQSVVLDDVTNAIMHTMAWIGTNGITILTGIDSLAITESLWSLGSDGDAAILVDPQASIRRRMRIGSAVIITPVNTIGISVVEASLLNTESFQLDQVNFSGVGTPISGIGPMSDMVRFSECRGVINSTRIGGMTWANNADVTPISGPGVPVKAIATSIANPLNQRFTHTNNRIEYVSSIPIAFYVTCTASIRSANNRQVEVLLYKNGNLIPGAIAAITTNGQGRAEGASAQGVVELIQGDFIELWVVNSSDAAGITVTDASIIVRGA